MSEVASLEQIFEAWETYMDLPEEDERREQYWWAVAKVMDWHLDNEHAILWQFILLAKERKMSDIAIGCLAAGPVEDLLAQFGDQYVDQVVELARADAKFNYLLGGVWGGRVKKEVWERVLAVRLSEW